MSIRNKTISGIIWSFAENAYLQIISFVFGIIVARFIEPREFGLISLVMIFISVSQSFVEGGLSWALIRKKDCSPTDYSTVFYLNMIVALILYALLFLFADKIAKFFNYPELDTLIKVTGIIIIIYGLGIVQGTQFTKEIEMKVLTKITILSSTVSVIIGLFLLYYGFGLWSLVWRTILQSIMRVLLLWYFNKWTPLFLFSLNSLKELLKFGYKIFATLLLNTIFENLYYFIIGKYFSTQQLGYYYLANTIGNIPSTQINGVIQRISYPILSKLQYDRSQMLKVIKKLMKNTMFISFNLMLILIAISDQLIINLVGIKWEQSIIYLKLLSISLMFYPLHSLNSNIINVLGRSDIYFTIELGRKFILIPVIMVGIIYGIVPMLLGMIAHSIISYFIYAIQANKLINYGLFEQIRDILPILILAITVSSIIFIIDIMTKNISSLNLFLQFFIGISLIVLLSEFFKLEPYFDIKREIFNRIFTGNKI